MIKKTISTLALVLVLLGGIFTPSAFAQAVDTPNSGDNAIPAPQNGTGQGTVQQQNDGTLNETGFDWRWLLPLLAIPVILLFWRAGTRDEEEHEYREYGGLAGAKGGRARRRSDVDEEDEVV